MAHISEESVKRVQELYVAYFGRPADPEGLDFYGVALDEGVTTIEQIATSFGNSAEAQETVNLLTTEDFIKTLYMQSFAREYDPQADGTFWLDAIESGAISKEMAFIQILQGAQNDDKAAVSNKAEAAQSFTAIIQPEAYDTEFAAEQAEAILKTVGPSEQSLTDGIAAFAELADSLNQSEENPTVTEVLVDSLGVAAVVDLLPVGSDAIERIANALDLEVIDGALPLDNEQVQATLDALNINGLLEIVPAEELLGDILETTGLAEILGMVGETLPITDLNTVNGILNQVVSAVGPESTLDLLLGSDGAVAQLLAVVLSEDGVVDGVLGQDGVAEQLLTVLVGEGGLAGGLLGGTEGLLEGLLGNSGGLVGGLLENNTGILDSITDVNGLLAEDGLLGSLLGGGLLGDSGVLGGLLGEDSVLEGLLDGADAGGLLGGLLGTVTGLLEGLLGGNDLVDGLLGDLLGGNDLVGDLLALDGVLDIVPLDVVTGLTDGALGGTPVDGLLDLGLLDDVLGLLVPSDSVA